MKISGIYKITNLLNGKCYIGQSTDIFNRYKEHLYHSESAIDKDIRSLGKDFFKLEIIHPCDPDPFMLDHLEKQYITIFRSNDPDYGYNISSGGQHDMSGEYNTNAKLTSQDVYNIRESYNNHERKLTVYERYKNIISFNGFEDVWQGKSWQNIHMDVYTNENKTYYRRQTSMGEKGHFSIFSDDEVIELRKRYVSETARSIYKSVENRCKFETLQSILCGRYYSHIPIYNKKNKKWIYSN